MNRGDTFIAEDAQGARYECEVLWTGDPGHYIGQFGPAWANTTRLSTSDPPAGSVSRQRGRPVPSAVSQRSLYA